MNDRRYCGAERRTACEGLDSLSAPFFILPRQRAVSAKPTRRERICPHSWSSHGIRTAVWTVRQEKRPGSPAGFRLPSRHGQSMASAFGSSRFHSPDSQPGESQDTRLDNSHGCCRDSRARRPVSAVVELFRQGALPPYGIVLTSKNKRDRNKAMTGKARIFRVSTTFTGLFPEKSAGNGFPC